MTFFNVTPVIDDKKVASGGIQNLFERLFSATHESIAAGMVPDEA